MKNAKSWFCAEEKDTVCLGQKLALFARRGDCFALNGTLGTGKSVLSRAFIQKLTGAAEVPSPTFTLVQSYSTPDFEIYHFDLYRLKAAEEIFELGMEEALYEGVCLIEWPEKMGAYLPHKAIRIDIVPENGGRQITVTMPQASERLTELD